MEQSTTAKRSKWYLNPKVSNDNKKYAETDFFKGTEAILLHFNLKVFVG